MESHWVTRLPDRALRGFVDRYVGYRMAGFEPGLHRGLPSRHLTFIVSIGSEIDVRVQSSAAQSPTRYRAVLGGLQSSPAVIAHDGNQAGIAIELTPLGCRALLRMPAAELWNLSYESAEVMGRAGNELWERLQYQPRWPERFAACDRILLNCLSEQSVAGELAWCWQRILATGGNLTVGRLAEDAGYSRQHLTRLFRREFGLGPKLASRVVRFERAERALRLASASPAGVATACGYADQAHLGREFVELAGCTPSELLAGDVPILQDGGACGQ